MRFTITSVGDNSTLSEVKFSLPIDEEICKAEEKIEQLCQEKLMLLYSSDVIAQSRLKTELELMKKTKTAFYFLILKEIAHVSLDQSAPLILLGSFGASFLQYLLEISEVNPLVVANCVCGFHLHRNEYKDSQHLWAEQEQVISAEVEKYYRKAKEIISLNHDFFEKIANALANKKLLSAVDIKQIKCECEIIPVTL